MGSGDARLEATPVISLRIWAEGLLPRAIFLKAGCASHSCSCRGGGTDTPEAAAGRCHFPHPCLYSVSTEIGQSAFGPGAPPGSLPSLPDKEGCGTPTLVLAGVQAPSDVLGSCPMDLRR